MDNNITECRSLVNLFDFKITMRYFTLLDRVLLPSFLGLRLSP